MRIILNGKCHGLIIYCTYRVYPTLMKWEREQGKKRLRSRMRMIYFNLHIMSQYGNYPITEEYKAKVSRDRAESIANSVKSIIKHDTKSNLTRRTSEELKEARCSAYKYLIP